MKLNSMLMKAVLFTAVSLSASGVNAESSKPVLSQLDVTYHKVAVQDTKIFYREAGNPKNPTIILLHGFPTSSFMYRELIPLLAVKYHVIAPDLPGFGFTEAPDRTHFDYKFQHLAEVMNDFTQVLGLKKYALQVFDYGAPVGLRLAMAHPERVTAIITQNGNAYEAGLGNAWEPIQKYWRDPSATNREALKGILNIEGTTWQYTHGVKDQTKIAPEAYYLDDLLMSRPENREIQLDLFLDYASNVALYPKFQQYFRDQQPPLLAVWGQNDPFFISAGAKAFKNDIPSAEIHLYDTGHFALQTHTPEIAAQTLDFLDRHVK